MGPSYLTLCHHKNIIVTPFGLTIKCHRQEHTNKFRNMNLHSHRRSWPHPHFLPVQRQAGTHATFPVLVSLSKTSPYNIQYVQIRSRLLLLICTSLVSEALTKQEFSANTSMKVKYLTEELRSKLLLLEEIESNFRWSYIFSHWGYTIVSKGYWCCKLQPDWYGMLTCCGVMYNFEYYFSI